MPRGYGDFTVVGPAEGVSSVATSDVARALGVHYMRVLRWWQGIHGLQSGDVGSGRRIGLDDDDVRGVDLAIRLQGEGVTAAANITRLARTCARAMALGAEWLLVADGAVHPFDTCETLVHAWHDLGRPACTIVERAKLMDVAGVVAATT